VERRVVSLCSSTEDFSIPALCEVGRDLTRAFTGSEMGTLEYFILTSQHHLTVPQLDYNITSTT